MDIQWSFFEQRDLRRLGLQAAARNAIPLDNEASDFPVGLRIVHINTVDPWVVVEDDEFVDSIEHYGDDDVDRIEQLHCLLDQLQPITGLAALRLDLGSFVKLHTVGSEPLWELLIRAFEQSVSWKALMTVDLEYRMIMHGQGIGIDFCVSRCQRVTICATLANISHLAL